MFETFMIHGSGTTYIFFDDQTSSQQINLGQLYNISDFSFTTNIAFIGGTTKVEMTLYK